MSGAPPDAPSSRGPLPGPAHTWPFFRAVYLIERMLAGHVPVGGRGPMRLEALRFRASTSLGFPVSELEDLRWIDTPDGPRAELTTHFLGLVGATSPLPSSYPEEVLQEEDRAPQLRDFLDLFHHRLLSLLYRSWLRHRHALAFEPGGADPLSRALLELIDVSPETPAETIGMEPARLLPYLGLLLMPTRPPGGLEAILGTELQLPVRVEPLRPRWIELTPAQRSRVDRSKPWRRGQLVIGRRMRDPSGRVTLVVGPIDASRLEALQPGGADFSRLVAFARFYLRQPIDLEVQILVPAEAMPRVRVGRLEQSRLKRAATVGRPATDPVVLTFQAPEAGMTGDERVT